jgi:5-methylcytosine-specific restriction enzyme subunit McrC
VTETIILTEYEDQTVLISQRDADFIFGQLGSKFTIRRQLRERGFVLNPGQYVGVVTLPSGTRVESRPKVPVSSLFYMLAISLEIPTFRRETVELERMDEVLDFVVNVFAEEVEQRIRNGLYRWYVEREDNLSAVRGRINFAQDIRENYILRQRTFCRSDEFTWDIPENQIIRQVCHFLSGWRFIPDTRLRLGQIDAELGEVSRTQFTATDIAKIHYHRLNEDYRHLHRLCRLFLEGASLSEDLGMFSFRAFLLDMNKLFEDFVCEILRRRAPARLRVDSQEQIYLDRETKILMKPDFLVSRAGAVVLAADCKYKKLDEREFKNHDIYQLLSYCTATKTRRGVLIYPKHVQEFRDSVQIVNSEMWIDFVSIDLGRQLSELIQSCDSFADQVFACVEE